MMSERIFFLLYKNLGKYLDNKYLDGQEMAKNIYNIYKRSRVPPKFKHFKPFAKNHQDQWRQILSLSQYNNKNNSSIVYKWDV